MGEGEGQLREESRTSPGSLPQTTNWADDVLFSVQGKPGRGKAVWCGGRGGQENRESPLQRASGEMPLGRVSADVRWQSGAQRRGEGGRSNHVASQVSQGEGE